MKAFFLPCLLFIFSWTVKVDAQNLVLNPSFEDYSSFYCLDYVPDTIGNVNYYSTYLKYWRLRFSIYGEIAAFNLKVKDADTICKKNSGAPKSNIGFQYPRSGDIYSGFAINSQITGTLSKPLIVGNYYYIEYYLALTEYYGLAEYYDVAPRQTVVYFSINRDDKIGGYYDSSFVVPTVKLYPIVSDTANWVKVRQCFKADSAFRYFSIGLISKLPVQNCAYFIDDVSIYEVPEIKVTNDSTRGCKDLAVKFEPTDKSFDNFTWDFGNGQHGDTVAPETQHYLGPNSYVATLLAEKNSGEKACFSRKITVGNPVSFFDGPNQITVGTKASFSNTSINANKYHWDFGDGASGSGKSPEHFYNDTGRFVVTLTSWDAINCSVIFKKEIEVVPCGSITKVNVITPNNDGVNDIFHFSDYPLCEEVEVKIYNRWGDAVYEYPHQLIDYFGQELPVEPYWNGNWNNVKGVLEAPGTYFFTVKWKGTYQKGIVSLVY